MKKILKIAGGLLGLALLCALAYFAYAKLWSPAKATNYRFGELKRADLLSTITATGTLEPEELVDVGAQVTGQIVGFGKDSKGGFIDYGSVVKAGDVLASIDDATYSAELESSSAALKQAEASLVNAKADIEQLKAKLALAGTEMTRAERLHGGSAISKADYETFAANLAVAKANLAVGNAKILAAEAALLQAKANRDKARRNLSYCTIRSPVDGVVIDRRVNIGQTVVSSMSTSSLFLIAKDLRKMQLWVSVNEADIGRIRPGQPTSFTVDAFPNETFKGEVSKIRLNASMSQNVVTYTVEVSTDNSSGRLLPYLTANVVFEVERLENALTVPNSALRWSPKGSFFKASSGDANAGVLWTPGEKAPRPTQVKILSSDGVLTALAPQEGLAEGMRVIVGTLNAGDAGAKDASGSNNPFLPKFRNRGKQQQRPPPP
jgi:HlyD family secretion protein